MKNLLLSSLVSFNVISVFNSKYIPLTIEAIDGGIVTISNCPKGDMWFSGNEGELTPIVSDSMKFSLDAGDKLSLYANGTGNTAKAEEEESAVYLNIQCSSDCYVYGNFMSLIRKDDYQNLFKVPAYAFDKLFFKNSHIRNHDTKNIVLPATTLADYCYAQMFGCCTSLTRAPELPATTLGDYCYYEMFVNCTNLTQAPKKMLATTMGPYCCFRMFYGCTSLTQAPALSIAEFAKSSCESMFGGCNSLKIVPSIVTPKAVLADGCCYRMFYGCTSLTQAPELPATKFAESSCESMFEGCTSLTTISSVGTMNAVLAENCCYNMFKGCTSLRQAPDLPARTLAESCYENMFQDCTSLTEAPELPATKMADSCYQSMFQGCTSLTKAPELKATSLVGDYPGGCYESMFQDCTSLNSITCLATDISAIHCTEDWLQGVSSRGTFTKAKSSSWAEGASGIPTGWTVKEQ